MLPILVRDDDVGLAQGIVFRREALLFVVQRLRRVLVLGPFDFFLDFLVPALDLRHALLRLGRRFGMVREVALQVAGVVIGHAGCGDGLHPGEFRGELRHLGLEGQLLHGEVTGNVRIDPGALAFGREEIALDPSAGGLVLALPDQQRQRIASRQTSLRDSAADRLRIVRSPAVRIALPRGELRGTVAGGAIGHGDIERDRPFGERREDRLGEIGKPHAAMDMAHGDAEAARDIFGAGALGNDIAIGGAFLGRGHRLVQQVLGKAQFARGGVLVLAQPDLDGMVLPSLPASTSRASAARRRPPAWTSNRLCARATARRSAAAAGRGPRSRRPALQFRRRHRCCSCGHWHPSRAAWRRESWS
jgi:hypothetical protein